MVSCSQISSLRLVDDVSSESRSAWFAAQRRRAHDAKQGPAGTPAPPALGALSCLCFNYLMTSKPVAKKEPDSLYFLKILMYFVLGTVWIKINGIPLIPAGALVGVLFAQHDKLMIDRRIEYAVLLIAAVFGLAGWGVFLAV
jgi:hypothetical protein